MRPPRKSSSSMSPISAKLFAVCCPSDYVVNSIPSISCNPSGRTSSKGSVKRATVSRTPINSRVFGRVGSKPFHRPLSSAGQVGGREENVGPLAMEQVPASIQPSPSADMRADDLWQQISALCPPEYRPVLLLKHQGMAIEDIARRTNLHPGSIRRILRNLASQISVTGPSTK